MQKQDINTLLLQIKNIILNKPLEEVAPVEDMELLKVQEALKYLAECLGESNTFLQHLSRGNLEAKVPSRHNFIASPMKELHSGLKHLAWQANQVAEGDYHQRVHFLGDFSNSFNKMIVQLEEREGKLKKKNDALSQFMELLIAVMDGMREWLVVIDEETRQVIYTNQAARESFYNVDTEKHICGESCPLLKDLLSYKPLKGEKQRKVSCCNQKKIMEVDSFYTEWNGKGVYVHLISDITRYNEITQKLEYMAFKDDLTGVYNRRYSIKFLQELLERETDFSVCFIDIDGLKKVNDTLGHHIGDTYIKDTVEYLQKGMRRSDTLCRIGGDEFVLILPHCQEADAQRRLLDLSQEIREAEKTYAMSISYGIVYIQDKNHGMPEEILQQADEKMYSFKKTSKKSRE